MCDRKMDSSTCGFLLVGKSEARPEKYSNSFLNQFNLFAHQGACSRRVPEPQWAKPWGSASTARTQDRDNCMFAVRGPQRTATVPCLTTKILLTKCRSSPRRLGTTSYMWSGEEGPFMEVPFWYAWGSPLIPVKSVYMVRTYV